MLTAERLKQVLHYDPDTGIFTWLVSSGRVSRGTSAGTNKDGYINISVDRRLYRAHRLAWLYMTGQWPNELLDHKDLNRSNNRWDNIRAANSFGNSCNSPKPSNNTSGYKGVRWYKANERWSAQIQINRKSVHLGYFDRAEEAHAAYCTAANELFGEFARVA